MENKKFRRGRRIGEKHETREQEAERHEMEEDMVQDWLAGGAKREETDEEK